MNRPLVFRPAGSKPVSTSAAPEAREPKPETARPRASQERARFGAGLPPLPDVSLKAVGRRNGTLPGGVSSGDMRWAAKALEKFGDNGQPLPANTKAVVAIEGKDGIWRRPGPDGQPGAALHGKFIFTRMKNGELRLGKAVNGRAEHLVISGKAMNVRYAGEVEFVEGKPVWYSNRSGCYVSSAVLRQAAGFDDTVEFKPEDPDGTLPTSDHTPVALDAPGKDAAIQAAESAVVRLAERRDSDTATAAPEDVRPGAGRGMPE